MMKRGLPGCSASSPQWIVPLYDGVSKICMSFERKGAGRSRDPPPPPPPPLPLPEPAQLEPPARFSCSARSEAATIRATHPEKRAASAGSAPPARTEPPLALSPSISIISSSSPSSAPVTEPWPDA